VIAAQESGGMFSWSNVHVAAPSCGDGSLMESIGEQCDDGNTTNGDGCNELCSIEVGYICPDGSDCHVVACGDGYVDERSESCIANERCDDQNHVSNDGCSASCAVEPGYRCTGEPSACVEIQPGDDCSSATALSNGQYSLVGFTEDPECENTCEAADRWLQVSIPAGSMLIVDLQSSQADPALPYARLFDITDGCGQASPLESRYVPFGEISQLAYRNQETTAMTVALVLLDDARTTSDLEFSVSFRISDTPGCGDGYVDYTGDFTPYEECDDGNAAAGDGCTQCAVDPDYTCNGSPSVCELI
jgi:cysteine-rich repeat protein